MLSSKDHTLFSLEIVLAQNRLLKMNQFIRQIIAESRPSGYRGRGDKYLADIAAELYRLILKDQGQHPYEKLVLDNENAAELAAIFVQFAEDIHADLGLWRSIESANQEYFGTPLPFLVEAGDAQPELARFDRRRLQHLLGVILPSVGAGFSLAPDDDEVRQLAEVASIYLTRRFEKMPTDSGIKQFLDTDNHYGWDVKRKLMWLGMKSYLFRHFYETYFSDNYDEDNAIKLCENFIFGECTAWSGMGVIDVLAGALSLPEEDRATVRSWYERHMSYYRVLTLEKLGPELEVLTARNVVNGLPYTIEMNVDDAPFVPDMIVSGALYPWRGKWCWSGEQETMHPVGPEFDLKARATFLQQAPSAAYCYCLPELEEARKFAIANHEQFLAFYGSDLIAFPDADSLIASEEKRLRAEGLKDTDFNIPLPPSFHKQSDGVGLFSSPTLGVEAVRAYSLIASGMLKKGTDLTDAECLAVVGIIADRVCSVELVQRLVDEHGMGSFGAVLSHKTVPAEFTLKVALRCNKGDSFRRCYPTFWHTTLPAHAG